MNPFIANMNMEEYNPKTELWEAYEERLTHMFNASCVVDESQQKSLLIKCIGANTYRLLRDLCFPSNPNDLNYAQLVAILGEHFTPAIVIFKERRTFYAASKGKTETAVQWSARIRRLAVNCKFGVAVEQNLVDKFVTSFDGKIFDRLCEEGETLTFSKAVEIAQRYESTTDYEQSKKPKPPQQKQQKPIQQKNTNPKPKPLKDNDKKIGNTKTKPTNSKSNVLSVNVKMQ